MEKFVNKLLPVLIASLAVYVWLDGSYALATLLAGILLTVFHTFLVFLVLSGVMLSAYPFVKSLLTDTQSIIFMNIAFVSFALGILGESIRMLPKLSSMTKEQHGKTEQVHEHRQRTIWGPSVYRYGWYLIGCIAIIAGIISNIVMK